MWYLAPLVLLLTGCDAVLLDPSGDIAAQQRDLLLVSTGLMLLIIVPVMALTVIFAWRYRQSNRAARYEPDWAHSTHLELVIWGAPLLIIICLGALTWMGTHLLDPYRPIERITADEPVPSGVETLEVQAVALDWKWLFFYPQYGIASVNEMAAPVDRPIRFRITASSVMNSFFIPTLAGQIYAMPGMETKLHAVINNEGEFEGFSANYSGAGFSGMQFAFHGLGPGDFDAWVETVRSDAATLDNAAYLELERPSENVPVMHYGTIDPALFDKIVNMCVEPGKLCMRDMMMMDMGHGPRPEASGEHGSEEQHSEDWRRALEYDKSGRRGGAFEVHESSGDSPQEDIHGGEEDSLHGAGLEPELPPAEGGSN
jgi:cytochrome o ubiquinol oxidase subunit II